MFIRTSRFSFFLPFFKYFYENFSRVLKLFNIFPFLLMYFKYMEKNQATRKRADEYSRASLDGANFSCTQVFRCI